MNRRFSTFIGKGSSSKTIEDIDDDAASGVSTVVRDEDLAPPSLKVKRVDYYYSRWTKSWKYRNMKSKITVETLPLMQSGVNDPWKDYSFVLVRTIPQHEFQKPSFKIVIKSEYLLKALKDVIQSWPGTSWHADPLEMDPEIFITFFHRFEEYRNELKGQKDRSKQDDHVLSCVELLLSSIASDYNATLSSINRLTAHAEITYDLLYAILVPRSLLVAQCSVTGLPRIFKLMSWQRTTVEGKPLYQLSCESIDLIDRNLTQTVAVGRVHTMIYIRSFSGTVRIDSLDAYPIQFHPDEAGLRRSLVKRGEKWTSLIGVHHKQFDGIAAFKCNGKVVKHHVKSRIMVDRATFHRLNTNYHFPTPAPTVDPAQPVPAPPIPICDSYGNFMPPPLPPPPLPPSPMDQMYLPPGQSYTNDGLVSKTAPKDDTPDVELSEEDILLTPPVVYGFSFTDKAWLEFNVDKIEEVDWNKDAFENLVLPSARKDLIQTLIDSHHSEIGFDDFIKGKGHGLVINLYGPPGVGKTFTAEATSEHVRRPLYVVGGADLGTSAVKLDQALERIFDIATAWKAIVLIDEADVFLEQRSLHDLFRNAMVAVFLRHVEYYRGILFLTTNRVKTFDEAFLSRIHVALHFTDLSQSSREQVWAAFINKVEGAKEVDENHIGQLATRNINGRQIKNAVRTANSLAKARKEVLKFDHLWQTLDALDEFTRQFESSATI